MVLDQLLTTTPLWVWLAVAATLGALTLYLFHRCFLTDARRQFALWDEHRRIELEEQRAQVRMLRGALSDRDGAAASDAADASEIEDELRAVKARSWALETRLRRALAAAEAGEAIDVAALSADIDGDAEPLALPEGAAAAALLGAAGLAAPSPAETDAARERSALKFANWTLRQRMRDASGVDARIAEAEAAADEAEAERAAAEERANLAEAEAQAAEDRALQAEDDAKAAEERARRAEETAAAQTHGPGDTDQAARAQAVSALAAASSGLAIGGAPTGDRGMRMADRLTRALTAAKLGNLNDLAAIEAEAAADAPPAILADLGPAGPDVDLSGDGPALRYRTWLLGRRLRETLGAVEAGAAPEADVIRRDLARAAAAPSRDAAAEQAAAAAETDALVERARRDAENATTESERRAAEAERLAAEARGENSALTLRAADLATRLETAEAAARTASVAAPALPERDPNALIELGRRIETLEAGLRRERARSDAVSAARAEMTEDAASLRYRLWLSHAELRRLRAAEAPDAASAQLVSNLTPQQLLASEAIKRATRADAAALRARLSQAEAALRALRADAAADRAALAAAETETENLRRELWSQEWREAQAAPPAAQPTPLAVPAVAAPDPAAEETLKAARRDAATLRARLWETEWAFREIDARKARETELAAELTGLKSQLAAAVAAQAALASADGDEAAAEAEASAVTGENAVLLTRAERAEREIETLRTRLSLAEAELARHARAPIPSQPQRADTPPVPAAPVIPADPADEAPVRGPMLGVEAAAHELLSRPAETLSADWPTGLAPFNDAMGADDLTRIVGLSDADAERLSEIGVLSFKQIAEISPEGLAWLDRQLDADGALIRRRWVPQAQTLRDEKARERARAAAEPAVEAVAEPVVEPVAQPLAASEPVSPSSEPPEVEPTLVSAPAALRAAMKAERADAAPTPVDGVAIDAPLYGVETAALDLIAAASFTATAEATPPALVAPADSADDLTLIHGVGPSGAKALNHLGLVTFAQMAAFAPEDLAWLDRALDADGRVVRERWLPQAQAWAEQRRAGALRQIADGAGAGLWTTPARAGVAAPAPTEAAPQPEPPAPVAPARGARRSSLIADLAPTPERAPQPELQGAAAETAPAPRSGGFVPAGLRTAFLRRAKPPVAPRRPAAAPQTTASGRAAIEAEAAALIDAQDPRLPAHRPTLLLPEPLNGPRDDLKLIISTGPKYMDMMNQIGVFYFAQLAQFDALDLAWLDRSLGASGRVPRDRWASQAEALQTRKSDGRLTLGAEGVWTEPSKTAETDAVFERARALPLTEAESGALRLLNEGGVDPNQTPAPTTLLRTPDQGPADDLQRIHGVGPRFEATLNRMGVYYFDQIAAFSAADLAWLDAKLHYNGRVVRDRWAAIAQLLIDGES